VRPTEDRRIECRPHVPAERENALARLGGYRAGEAIEKNKMKLRRLESAAATVVKVCVLKGWRQSGVLGIKEMEALHSSTGHTVIFFYSSHRLRAPVRAVYPL